MTLNTSSLTVTSGLSSLYHQGKEYSLIYSYMIGGMTYLFYVGESEIYSGVPMTFDTSTVIPISFPTALAQDVSYEIVVYIGRIREDSIIRISDIVVLQVADFSPQQHTLADMATDTPLT